MLKKSFFAALVIFSAFVFAAAQSLKYSPDGKTLSLNFIVNSESSKAVNQFLFFDVLSGKIKSSLNVANSEIEEPRMFFASNNQNLIISDRTNISIIQMSADNKGELKEFANNWDNYSERLVDLAVSADGKTLFTLYADELRTYDFLTQKPLTELNKKIAFPEDDTKRAEFLAMQPNGQTIVEFQQIGSKHTLIMHNLAAKTFKTIELPYDFADHSAKFSASISQNGETLALRCAKDQFASQSQITVWNLKTGKTLGTFSFKAIEAEEANDFYPIENFGISPNGQKLALKINDSDNEKFKNMLVLWDVAAKKETIAEAKKYSEEDFAHDLVFSPDSKTLAISSKVLLTNSFSAKIQLFDANTGKLNKDF